MAEDQLRESITKSVCTSLFSLAACSFAGTQSKCKSVVTTYNILYNLVPLQLCV
jgi:hypothetical protein